MVAKTTETDIVQKIQNTNTNKNLYSAKFVDKTRQRRWNNETYTQTTVKHYKLEYGPMPNVMAALTNIGGALCSTPQSLADAHYWSAVQ